MNSIPPHLAPGASSQTVVQSDETESPPTSSIPTPSAPSSNLQLEHFGERSEEKVEEKSQAGKTPEGSPVLSGDFLVSFVETVCCSRAGRISQPGKLHEKCWVV